ncbi:hypothetical protein BCR44DRAFT_96859 [Catenaria anguillulae PL171]|uniref:Uncharacterized protein n=1 Tax=Catenaria anguillulae PL171 TaxID=765915 RepID=A0A1Y2H8S1_9FUNG|nr:hypothetical protein BCR44DRAFT_96859 [Catenaria anguillulae PL171]
MRLRSAPSSPLLSPLSPNPRPRSTLPWRRKRPIRLTQRLSPALIKLTLIYHLLRTCEARGARLWVSLRGRHQALGEWINPRGKSKAELWGLAGEREWQNLGGGAKLGKTVCSKWMFLMIPSTVGMWEIARLGGARQAHANFVRDCHTTASELERVMAALPESLQAESWGQEYGEMCDSPIEAKLLDVFVSRARLSPSGALLTPDTIPVLVKAMDCETMWRQINLPLISALPRIPDAFRLVLKLILQDDEEGAKADAWANLLAPLLDIPVTVDQLDAVCHLLVERMKEHKNVSGLGPNGRVPPCVLNAIVAPPALASSSSD